MEKALTTNKNIKVKEFHNSKIKNLERKRKNESYSKSFCSFHLHHLVTSIWSNRFSTLTNCGVIFIYLIISGDKILSHQLSDYYQLRQIVVHFRWSHYQWWQANIWWLSTLTNCGAFPFIWFSVVLSYYLTPIIRLSVVTK